MMKTMSLMAVLLLLAACSEGSGNSAAEYRPLTLPVVRITDRAILDQGRRVYAQNCAGCHGMRGEGAANWRKQDPEGRFPPPPLNGAGHSWHHPTEVLRQVIHDGGPVGRSNMPGWGQKLSRQEIDAVIAWFQSLWPEQAFEAWSRMETRIRREDAEG